MKKWLLFLGMLGVVSFTVEAASREKRVVYNEAVTAFESGDITNVTELLHPFSADKNFSEAAELYGAAVFRLAEEPDLATNTTERIKRLGDAAAAFQTALGSSPDDLRRQANLQRAIKDLPVLREEQRLKEITQKYEKVQPMQLIARMLQEEREILTKGKTQSTNQSAVVRISEFERLAKKQREVDDMWVVLRPSLADSNIVTNEEQRAMIVRFMDETQSAMQQSVHSFEDIDESALIEAEKAENGVYSFWLMTAEPPALMQEGLQCESNVVVSPLAPRYPLRGDDSENALELSGAFADRFPAWAEQIMEQEAQMQQQGITNNAPSFTPNSLAEIGSLLESLIWLQRDNCKNTNRVDRIGGAEEACKKIERILELLPKPPQQNKQNNQQKQQEQQQEQQEQEQQEQQQEQEDSAEEKNQESEEEVSESEENQPSEDVEEVLRQALQREREHEAEKQKQRKNFPMPAGARDW